MVRERFRKGPGGVREGSGRGRKTLLKRDEVQEGAGRQGTRSDAGNGGRAGRHGRSGKGTGQARGAGR